MFVTVEQDKKFNVLYAEIGQIYRRPAMDGNFQVDPKAQKQKTKEFMDAVTALAKLTSQIVENNERPITNLSPEDFSKMLNSSDTSIERAKARADAKLFKRRG